MGIAPKGERFDEVLSPQVGSEAPDLNLDALDLEPRSTIEPDPGSLRTASTSRRSSRRRARRREKRRQVVGAIALIIGTALIVVLVAFAGSCGIVTEPGL